MNLIMLSLHIALRYLFSRKSHGAINVISAISLAGVAVATAAMIIVLSVFNGFTWLAESKLSRFDPDLTVVPAEGKTLTGADSVASLLEQRPEIAVASPSITEQAFAISGGNQMPVTVKGMEPRALEASGLRGITIDGVASLSADSFPVTPAIMSVGTAMGLAARPGEGATVAIYEPRRKGRINAANPMSSFRSDTVMPVGVYQVEQEEYDRDIIIVGLETARGLLDYADEASGVSVYLAPGVSADEGKWAVRSVMGEGYVVKDRLEQQEQAFRMIAVEKWISFLMLLFILVIASFNIISSLSMMIIEKEGNMDVMTAMGATRGLIRSVFMTQGWLITVCGGLGGLVVGSLLVLGQRHFGWIRLAASDPSLMAIDFYPVELSMGDVAAVAGAMVVVAFGIAGVTALLLRRK